MHPFSHVFVVDDDPAIASTLCTILEGAGFAARGFTHPHALLQAAVHHRPDVVLADVMMPGMNGLDLALQLQMENPACKVVLFSGHVETAELLAEARRHGHDFEILLKPVRPAALLRRVWELVGAAPAAVGQ